MPFEGRVALARPFPARRLCGPLSLRFTSALAAIRFLRPSVRNLSENTPPVSLDNPDGRI